MGQTSSEGGSSEFTIENAAGDIEGVVDGAAVRHSVVAFFNANRLKYFIPLAVIFKRTKSSSSSASANSSRLAG
jgi:hypothetical protein